MYGTNITDSGKTFCKFKKHSEIKQLMDPEKTKGKAKSGQGKMSEMYSLI